MAIRPMVPKVTRFASRKRNFLSSIVWITLACTSTPLMGLPAETGVSRLSWRSSAVDPINTIFPSNVSAGIFPLSTSAYGYVGKDSGLPAKFMRNIPFSVGISRSND